MSVLALEESLTRESFITEQSLMRPTVDSTPPHSVGTRKKTAVDEEDFEAWLERASQVVASARAHAAAVPSPTNLIRLAQAQYAAGDPTGAAESAVSAMTFATELVETGRCPLNEVSLVFGSGANLLARVGRHAEAAEFLERVGPPEVLQLTYASLLIDADRLDEAFDVITSTDDPHADALRGYILARRGETQRAVHFLRQSLKAHPSSADTVMNLATAYWKLGSRRKAISAALRATRLAPSRQDISVGYMQLLLDNGQPAAVLAEVKRLRRSGVIECARLLVMECQAELAVGEPKKAITLMRRALAAAESEGDEGLRDELAANLRVLQASAAGNDRQTLWRLARECVEEMPHNVAALRQLAAYSGRRHESETLRKAIDAAGRLQTPARLEVEAKLAFIECDFGRSLSLNEEAIALDPMNAEACASALLLQGWHRGDWESAAEKASLWSRKVPLDPHLINNAAYAMALGGRPAEALALLDLHPRDDDFVPIATRGLAYLALNDLDAGMRWYRRAAELADSVGEGDMRILMALHQAAGLRTLGIAATVNETFLHATSLPDTGLPTDWEDQPSFVMIQQGCERQGWPWPPQFE
jgi:tetratricopeptide (TPR) repeat protein